MRINLQGHKFGKLTVIEFVSVLKERTLWLCRCDCGQSKVMRQDYLTGGRGKSCGCLSKEMLLKRTTHNKWGSREYNSWGNMIQRCTNKNHNNYKLYGGRGITVCDRWLESFENFYEDMGLRPKGTSLDRKDNDGNYCKENCKWSTQKEQCNNTRRNRINQLV